MFFSRAQKWRRMSAMPSTLCDVVVTFPSITELTSVNWFTEVLRSHVPQLVILPRYHSISGQHCLYLTASYRDLLSGAETLRIRKRLLEKHGGGLREFSIEDLDLFENVTDEDVFLTSSERRRIVHHFLTSLRAVEGDKWEDKVEFSNGQSMIRPLQSAGLIEQIFPLHNTPELSDLTSIWVHGMNFRQPLDEVKDYFGVRIALYFAWLGHYTRALVYPALFGFIVWLCLDSEKNPAFYYLLTAAFNVIWCAVYLEHWKRTNTKLSYRWGTWDVPPPLLEEPRPYFKGKLGICPITGSPTRVYPEWRRRLILCLVTAPIILVSLIGVVLVTLCFVHLQERMDALKTTYTGIAGGLLSNWPKIILALTISVMDVGYKKLATWLTDLENHRLDETYYNYYVGKLILLQFMNSFFSIIYTAFYLQDMNLLRKQLAALLITRQIVGNIKEVFLPYGQTRLRQVWLSLRYEQRRHCDTTSDGVQTLGEVSANADTEIRHRGGSGGVGSASVNSEESCIPQAEREATKPCYEDPTDDFLEMVIQFGYVSMFGCVFPVAGALAFINNIVEVRSDAFKLIQSFQRPFPKPTTNIAIWQLSLEIISYVAVVCNTFLLWVSGCIHYLLPSITPLQGFCILVCIEHVIFVLRFTTTHLLSSVPSCVDQEIAKMEHKRREALKTVEREAMREYHRKRASSEHAVTPDNAY